MDKEEIALYRLANQQISAQSYRSPREIVEFMGALQAQDYQASLWAIGLRLKDATKSDVEEAISSKSIVRTWPMRHTLHFVSPKDVRWMLGLYRDKTIPSYQRRNGLTEEILAKGEKIIARAFESRSKLAPSEIYAKMAGSGIPELKNKEVQAHILRRAGRDGIVCYASHDGKQPTFALLDEWVIEKKELSNEQVLSELASRYFKSHGPATIKDFVWWSGIRVSDARIGIGKASPKLREEEIEGKTYYMPGKMPKLGKDDSSAHLLPAFDEYIISYSDRSAMLGSEDTQKMLRSGKIFFTHSNGIFLPVIVINGTVVGTWGRINQKPRTEITIKPFTKLAKDQLTGIEDTVERYGNFLDMRVTLK